MIIVTGGAGFIGSTLVWKLNKLGIENIIIVDEFGKDDKYRNLISLKFLDVIDKDDFKDKASDFFKKNKVDTIFHLGACSSTTELDVNFLLKNNTEYSKLLCMQAVENNIRFINASSGATYGSGKQGYSDDESKLENLIPLNPYGYSKHLFDLWAKHNDYLDKIASLKYFNVYGPNEYHKKDMMSVVNKCFYQIKETGKARLFKTTSTEYGDGEQRRDFIYVKDAVDMTIFFYDNKTVNGIYNLGTGKANTFNDFVKPIFEVLGMKENIEYFDMPDVLKDRYQDFTQAEMDKLRKAGYDKEVAPIKDAVTDYVKNYLNTENPYLH